MIETITVIYYRHVYPTVIQSYSKMKKADEVVESIQCFYNKII